jgi:hypothetical protein
MMSSYELFSCRIFRQMANLYFRIAILRRDQVSIIRNRRGMLFCHNFICIPYLVLFFCSTCMTTFIPCSAMQMKVPSPRFPHQKVVLLLTSQTGRLSPNDAVKRDREPRRSSIRNELASPVSAAKGERRIPSHGVWTLSSQRENWRTNLSLGIRTSRFIVLNCLLSLLFAAQTCASVGFYLYVLTSKAAGM